MTLNETKEQLDKYVDEINASMDSNYFMSKFLCARGQLMILVSMINVGGEIAVDMKESLSKDLVIKRALGACDRMLELIDDVRIKLNEARGDKR